MNRNSKLRDRIRDATNEAILAAAEAVFAEEGLYTAKVEAIAARAGVSVGTIYNHLGDRDRVLTMLVETRKAELNEHLARVLQDGEGLPFLEQLKAFLKTIIQHFEEHQKFFFILMQGELRKATSPTQMQEAIKQIFGCLTTLIDRGLSQGALRPEMADLYPAFLLGMVRSSFMYNHLLQRESQPLLPRLDQFVHFFMCGGGTDHG